MGKGVLVTGGRGSFWAGAVVSLPTELHSGVSRCCLLTKMAPNASPCEIPCWLIGEGAALLLLPFHLPMEPPAVHMLPFGCFQDNSHSGYLERGGKEEGRKGLRQHKRWTAHAADYAAIKIHTAVLRAAVAQSREEEARNSFSRLGHTETTR